MMTMKTDGCRCRRSQGGFCWLPEDSAEKRGRNLFCGVPVDDAARCSRERPNPATAGLCQTGTNDFRTAPTAGTLSLCLSLSLSLRA